MELRRAASRRAFPRFPPALLAAAACSALSVPAAQSATRSAAADADGVAFFEQAVRPLLSARCLECHDERKHKSGLRLDSYAAILAGGERGPAVDRADPRASLLLRAVRYGDPDLQMPPKARLEELELAVLERWFERGAPGPEGAAVAAEASGFDLAARADWWSFRPLADPAPPRVADPAWGTNPVDGFVRARLDAAGLEPAPPADRAAIARRLYLDLTGLPPSPDELARYLEDRELGAYGRLVDRALASPHYAERFARHWLDLVRYAETKGHEYDFAIPGAFEYRDYVIRAFDADVPYDRLVTEHVAGDLLAEPRISPEGWNESVLGTGWWWLGEEFQSPVDTRADHLERAADKLDTFGKAFLGLTVACARCHDHKFDPIRSADYYSLAGYVLSSGYRQARFETLEADRAAASRLSALDAAWRAHLLERISGALSGAREELLAAAEARSDSRVEGDIGAAFGDGSRLPQLTGLHAGAVAPPPSPRAVIDFSAAGPDDFRADGHAFSSGPRAPGDPYLDPRGALRLETRACAAFDPAWSALCAAPGAPGEAGAVSYGAPGRTLRTPTFRLESGKLHYLVRGGGYAFACVDSHRLVHGPLHGKLVLRIDEEGVARRWRWVEHDLSDYAGHVLHVELSPGEGHDLSLAAVVEGERAPDPPEPAQGRDSLAAALDALESRALREEHALTIDALLADPARLPAAARGELEQAAAEYGAARAYVAAPIRAASRTAPAMLDGSAFDEELLARGSPGDPVHPVPRAYLDVFGGAAAPAGGAGSGRLELARRMVSDSGALLARARVNRVWKHLFGRGLAPSVDDLGRMGESPTHPELLDYLARWFMEHGWSQRELIRLLVTSRAYRMASAGNAAADLADPDNRLLHRANAKRLEAEAIRDSILAVSGTLDRARFGPSVPVHLTEFLQGRGRPEQSGPLDGAGRRSIYLSVRRNFLPPFLTVFDFPSPAHTTGRRTVSNVPAQALAMLNDPFVVQESRRWAERALAEPRGGDAERLGAMYLRAFARPPSDAERADALAYLAARRAEAPELDAWADLAHVLLNSVELVLVP